MALRIKPSPPRPELEALLKAARDLPPMTPAQLREQRISAVARMAPGQRRKPSRAGRAKARRRERERDSGQGGCRILERRNAMKILARIVEVGGGGDTLTVNMSGGTAGGPQWTQNKSQMITVQGSRRTSKALFVGREVEITVKLK